MSKLTFKENTEKGIVLLKASKYAVDVVEKFGHDVSNHKEVYNAEYIDEDTGDKVFIPTTNYDLTNFPDIIKIRYKLFKQNSRQEKESYVDCEFVNFNKKGLSEKRISFKWNIYKGKEIDMEGDFVLQFIVMSDNGVTTYKRQIKIQYPHKDKVMKYFLEFLTNLK